MKRDRLSPFLLAYVEKFHGRHVPKDSPLFDFAVLRRAWLGFEFGPVDLRGKLVASLEKSVLCSRYAHNHRFSISV